MSMKGPCGISSARVMNVTIVIIFMITVGAIYPSCAHFEMSGSVRGISSGDYRDDSANNNPPQPSPLASNNWTNTNPSLRPSGRYGHMMAYDSKSDRVIFFGGYNLSGTNDDTWAYDLTNNTWKEMKPNVRPSARAYAPMAYDPTHDRVILFGGYSGTVFSQTWSYDFINNTWTQRFPSVKPSAREGHTMVFDPKSNRMILFGGYDLSKQQADTWAYDYTSNNWTQRFPTNAPTARFYHSMAYDSSSDKTLMFGGYDKGSYLNDIWAYNYTSNNWTQRFPTGAKPAPRYGNGIVYDSQDDRTILFGGWTGNGPGWDNETWTYDYKGNAWKNMFPATRPSVRYQLAMVYDSIGNCVILFSGSALVLNDETWIYQLAGGTSGPYVVSTKPKDGDINVPVNTNIVITFSTSMDVGVTPGAISSVPTITGSFTFDGTMKIVTWVPDSNLKLGTKYTITISTQARSFSGINMKFPYVFSFTTIPPPDTFPPYVVSTNPNNGDTNVPNTTKVAITWNESMNKASAQNAFSSAPPITCAWSWTIVTQTCTPSVALQFNTKYTITISTTAKDLAGNNMKNNYKFSFNTSQMPDIYPPYIVSTTPTNGATNVSNATKIDIKWNESMNQTSAEGAFSSSPAIVCAWSWSGTNQTCTPSSVLQSNTNYMATIATTAKDLAGNALKNTYTFSFTTAGGGPSPPTVISTSPQNGTTNVSINANITIEFSDAMNKSATEGAISSSPSITGAFAWDGTAKIVTWDPTTNLMPSTQYTVTVSTSAKGKSGMNMVMPYKFIFTTSSLPPDFYPPYVTGTNPKDKDIDVLISTKITVNWNESMDTPSAESAVSSTPGIKCTWSWNGVTQTCSPMAALKATTKYTIIIATTAKDLAGNSMKSPYTFSFTTASGSIPTPPKVTRTTPANETIGVPLDAKISITFDKSMDKSATEGATSASPSIAWTTAWSSGDAVVTFTPAGNLQGGKQYTITVSINAKSSDDANLAYPYSFSFKTKIIPDTTPPTVMSTDPTNNQNDVDKNTKITITFSEAMDTAATGNAISISPGTITDKMWRNGDTTLVLSVALEDGKTYAVTISTGAKDTAGNAMVSSYAFTFTTKSSTGGLGEIAMFLGLLALLAITLALLLFALIRLKKRALCPECGEPYPKYTNVCSNCGYDFIRKTKKPLLPKGGKKASLSITTTTTPPQERRPEERVIEHYPPIVSLSLEKGKKTDIEATKVDEQPKGRRMRLSSTKKTDIEISEEETEARKVPASRQAEDIAERRRRARERMLKSDKKEDIERSEEETEPRKTDDIAEKRRRARERMFRRKRSS